MYYLKRWISGSYDSRTLTINSLQRSTSFFLLTIPIFYLANAQREQSDLSTEGCYFDITLNYLV